MNKKKKIMKNKQSKTNEDILLSAKFRYLNEFLYKNSSEKALSHFKTNEKDFFDYHKGYSH